MSNHICKTRDGVDISIGLKVIDYDNRQGVVIGEPTKWDFEDEVCWPEPGHNGHWWRVCPDQEGHEHDFDSCPGRVFDGSRLTTRGVKE